eukprot:GHVT01067358.1.p2 GENE.GHVT01067358.1~~GHVT01067358.1.p2  ORF type:complete len:110 (-),score=21.54 GHVT01067358.1:293-622(-)
MIMTFLPAELYPMYFMSFYFPACCFVCPPLALVSISRLLPLGLVDAEAVDLEVALRLNLCASHFNRDEFTRCLDQLEHVLLKKPNHSKALYKQAQVKLKLQVRPLMLQP